MLLFRATYATNAAKLHLVFLFNGVSFSQRLSSYLFLFLPELDNLTPVAASKSFQRLL
jgi:hypothetical protein